MTVTATLRATGVEWPDALPAGWRELTDTTAEFVVRFERWRAFRRRRWSRGWFRRRVPMVW